MKTTLPVNAQTDPIRKESPTRNTDVLIASFTGSGKGREKKYLFHHNDCNCMLTQSQQNTNFIWQQGSLHVPEVKGTCTKSL